MKKLPLFVGLIAVCLSSAVHSSAQSSPTITVDMGEIYGIDRDIHSTVVVDGGGIIPNGTEFFWLCLEIGMNLPDLGVGDFFLVDINDISWDADFFPPETRAEIATALGNMYYHHQAGILSDYSGDGTAVDFQYATWVIIEGRKDEIWTESFDTEAVEALLEWGWLSGGAPVTPERMAAMLNAALTPAPPVEIYWGVPLVDGVQPTAFFIVPEPGSTLLLGLAGAVVFYRRRCG